MWTCPKCGREFKRTNQGHYCGEPPATVEEYIGSQPPEARAHLRALRRAIRERVPGARERIAWSMPAYGRAGNSISFCACKEHVSFYVGEEAIAAFQSRLDGFTARKSAVYLPYGGAFPAELAGDLAAFCLGQPESGGRPAAVTAS